MSIRNSRALKLFSTTSAVALAITSAKANPTGGVVVSGSAAIATPSVNSLIVTQSTSAAIINWQSFSIGVGQSTQFIVPAGGVTLNRVVTGNPSAIYGSLSSNGRLILVNPNGIVVGPSGTINTAGLVLTTVNISDKAFLAGGANYHGNSNAAIINQGTIKSMGGGDIMIMARRIDNSGTIMTPGGTVTLKTTTTTTRTDVLIRTTDTPDSHFMVRPHGATNGSYVKIAAIAAELRAAGGNHYALAVNNTGVVRATGAVTRGGRTFLTGSGGGALSSAGSGGVRTASLGTRRFASHHVSPRKFAASASFRKFASHVSFKKVYVTVKRPAAVRFVKRPTAIHLVKRTIVHTTKQAAVDISGTIDVSNPNGVGGKVVVQGPTIHLASSAIIMASGSTGGGTVMIGGGAHGTDASIVDAQTVTVDTGAMITANATQSGDGGQVVVWSNVSTVFNGTISAQALGASGNGGSVEVSGATLTYNGLVNTLAANGATGTLLLDPGQVNIVHDTTNANNTADTLQDDKVAAALATTNFTVQTANATGANGATQNIVIQAGVVIDWNAPATGNTTLTLQAGNNITAYDNVNIQNRGAGTLNQQGGIVFDAGANIYIGDAGVTGNLGTARTGAVFIGSQYGVTRMVSGDPGFTGAATTLGTVFVTGGDTAGSYAQIGYNGAAPKVTFGGGGFVQAGAITVIGGGVGPVGAADVALTGGTAAGSFAQIGDGGVGAGAGAAGTSIGDIYGANISVVESSGGGIVALNTRGIETSFAQIGDGYSLTLAAGATTVGNISGNIAVTTNALGGASGVALNGVVTPTLANAPGNVAALAVDNPNVFMAQIGNGSHIEVPTTASTLTTGNLAGTITIGGTGPGQFNNVTIGSAIAPGTYTANVINAGTNPVTTTPNTVTAPAYQVFSQIGHGNFVRLGSAVGTSAGTYTVNLGSIAPLVDPVGITVGTDISITANSIAITSVETPTNNPVVYSNLVRNIEDGQIGSGNIVRQEEGTNATGTGNTTTLMEGDITGNVSVIANAAAANGITLTSTITGGVATTAAQGGTIPANVTNDQMLARIGHGSFVQLETASGAAGNAGGSINYTQANVLQSSIIVQTQNAAAPVILASSITAAGGTAANPAGNIVTSTVLTAVGSGGEVELRTGNGGASIGAAVPGGNAGDITFAKGTVWDGYEPTGLLVSNYVAYDSSIQIISANAIAMAATQTAGGSVAGGGGAVDNNNGLARIGHGSYVTLASGNGGNGTQAGSTNGGRGGDITVTQQTPGRDYGGTGAADDLAYGLRGQISLQATVAGTIAVGVQSLVTAGVAVASNNSNSAQIGHGDFISAVSGNGGNGGPSSNGIIPVGITAFGARAGNVNIDLHNMLIESNIVSSDNNAVQGAGGAAQNTYAASLGLALGNGITPTLANGTGITGEVVVNSVTTNGQGAIGAASASQHNWSDATIGHGEAVFVKSGNGGNGGGGGGNNNGATSAAFLTNGVPVQTSEAITDAYFSINPATGAPAGGSGIVGAGAVGSGAATGGNGGDIQLLLGTVTNRTGTIGLGQTGLLHNGNANVLLTIKGANAGTSLLVNSQIVSGPNVDGNGDDVSATVGARTKVLAVGGTGGAGGNANASFDPYIALGFGAGTAGVPPVPIQSDASGGRGGDVMIGVGSGVTGTKTVTITGAAANPAPAGAAVIGNVVVQADGAVTVASINQGGYALTNSNIGNYAEISGVAQAGGTGGTLYGTGAVLGTSGANDGIADTNGPAVQIVINYNAASNATTGVGEGVSVLGNGNPDSVTSIAAERANAASPVAVRDAMFYDAQGNPELIENAAGVLVANTTANNAAFAANANNIGLFGRTVGYYNGTTAGGVANNNVQYIQLGFGVAGAAPVAATGRPDLVVGVLTGVNDPRAGAVSVVDVNNNHIYDQISGRVRLADNTVANSATNSLGQFGLLDYTAVTGITPVVTAQNTLIWSGTAAAGTAPSATLNGNIAGLDTPVTGLSTPADGLMTAQLGSLPAFSTSNGGRGGDVGTQSGWIAGNVVVDANLNVAVATLPVGVTVASNVNGLTAAAGGGVGPGFSVAQANIGDKSYQISDTGGYEANRIAGSTYAAGFVSGAANGGTAGGNAVNASGGRGGNASLIQGAARNLYFTNVLGVLGAGPTEMDFLVGNILVDTNINNRLTYTVNGAAAYQPGGVAVAALDDNNVTSNVSTATIGQRAFAVAGAGATANAGDTATLAGNVGGNGTSFAGNTGGPASPISTITQVANGGMGGITTATQGQLKGLVTVMAGPQPGGTDFSVNVTATKGATGPAAAGGGAQPPGDSNDTIIAQIGDGRLATAAGGTGGVGASARYQANGGAGGSAVLNQLAILDTAILVDSFTYSAALGGNGVNVATTLNQGGNQLMRGQIGHGDVAFASGGAGGAATQDASITENLNQTALGGNAGNATISQGTAAAAFANGNGGVVIGGSFDYIDQNVTVSAGSAIDGSNAISVTSTILTTVNTAGIVTPDHVVATIGQGSYALAATQAGGAGGGNGGTTPGITSGVDPAFYQGLDVAAAAANAQTALAPLERNGLTLGTYRNGGNGGNSTVTVGDIGYATDNRSGYTGIVGFPTAGYFPNLSYGINNLSGQSAVSVTAHNLPATPGGLSVAGFNGILVQAQGGRDNNTAALINANVATIGNTTFARADASGAAGGSALQTGTGGTISEGNGGYGGSGIVTTGSIVGDINVTNVVAGELSNSGTLRDTNITVQALVQSQYDSSAHQTEARIGDRVYSEAYGGAGGASASPGPGPAAYTATISSLGGNGGLATSTSGAIVSNLTVTAENSVIVNAANTNPGGALQAGSPFLVATIGSDQTQAAVAGAGGVGGTVSNANVQDIFNALARYKSLGANTNAFSELSSYDQMLVAPIVYGYYNARPIINQVMTGPGILTPTAAFAAPVKDITPFLNQILTYAPAAAPATDPAGVVLLNGLARDAIAAGGTPVSASESATILGLSAGAGQGGAASIVQGAVGVNAPYAAGLVFAQHTGITGNIAVVGIGGFTGDAARGVQVTGSSTGSVVTPGVGASAPGAEVALVGNEQTITRDIGGAGPDVRAYSTGIGGDGGAASATQNTMTGNVTLTAGSLVPGTTTNLTKGAILVQANDAGQVGNQVRAWVGSRQSIGSDRVSLRPAAIVQGGAGGGSTVANSNGYLGNGGAVTIVQAGMPGIYDTSTNQIGTNDIRLQAYSVVGILPNSVQILSTEAATMTAGQTSVEIGNSILTASAQGGNAGVFGTPGPASQGLYGVRQANGGSVSFTQGTLTLVGGATQSDAIVSTIGIEGTNAVLVQSTTSAANGMNAGGGNNPIANVADVTIGNEMIAGDQKYGGGFYNGTQLAGGYGGMIVAGNGGNAPIEDVNSGNNAPGQTDPAATPVYDANGGNVLMSLGRMRVTQATSNGTNAAGANAAYATNVVTITSDLGTMATGATSVITNAADGGHSTNFVGQQQYVNVVTGAGGVAGNAEMPTSGQGGSAVITRNTVSGDITLQSLAANSETKVDAISTTAGTADNLVGHTVTFNVTSGRGGYGTDVYMTGFNTPDPFGFASGAGLNGELTSFIGAGGTATYRDAVVAVHTIENVVQALTLVNNNAARYSAADQVTLANNLIAAQNALTAAQGALAAGNVVVVQVAANNARTALQNVHTRVGAIGNGYADQVSNNANGGNITYTATDPVLGSIATAGEGTVSGNVTLQAAPPTVLNGPYGIGIVRVTAEGGAPTNQTTAFNANSALSEIGHRNAITNTSGVGGGSHTGAATDGGVAGNGGNIVTSQTTTGNVTINADTVVLTPTSGTTGTATVQILADVKMTNGAGDSDVAADLGQGGNITATQTSSGTAFVSANYISSTDTLTGAAANDMLSANQNLAASVLGIGIVATSTNNSTSDVNVGGTHPSDANRGGTVVASQTVSPGATGNMFSLNLDLNATGTHKRDLIVAANGGTFAAGFPAGAAGTNVANDDVRIGSYATQTAVSGNTNDGSDVTATQSVTGNIVTAGVEDMMIMNAGTGAAGVHIGLTGVQTAQSGLINNATTDYYGGVTTATQTVTGAITLPVSRSFAIATNAIQTFTPAGGALTVAPATDALQIGSNATQTATSADRRTPATTYPHYPQVAAATTPNVVSNQTSGGAISITAAQINLTDANNRAVVAPSTPGVLGFAPVAGVQIGNASSIAVDTQNAGIAMSTSNTVGTVALTTTNPLLAPAQQDATIATPLLGDINLTAPAQTVMNAAGTAVIGNNNGVVQVGASSTSIVSHNPTGGQPTGTFMTAQNIGNTADPTAQPISINAYDNLSLTEGAAGMAGQTGGAGQARIGDYINETGLLSTTNAVQAGSVVAQTVSSNINANVGNSLGLVSQDTGGLVEIGHYSPPANNYQVTGGVVITPQTLAGSINVLVGTAVAKAAVGDVTNPANVAGAAPAIGALGTNNILIDTNGGTFQNNPGVVAPGVAVQQEVGGEARIGSRFASPLDGGTNQTQTANGNIFVQAGSHLADIGGGLGFGSVIGHGPYDYADAPTVHNTSNTVAALGVIRNRVMGDTSVGASQNSPNLNSNVLPNYMTFDASAGTVSVNSGYGGMNNADVAGQLRFFIPSRTNLTITPSTGGTATLVTSANLLPVFNDSASNADSTLARTNNNTNIFQGQGGQNHEQPFQLMGTTPNYTQTYYNQFIGTGNYTFYFPNPSPAIVFPPYVYIGEPQNWVELHGALRGGFNCDITQGDTGSIGSFGRNQPPDYFAFGYAGSKKGRTSGVLAENTSSDVFGLGDVVGAGACDGATGSSSLTQGVRPRRLPQQQSSNGTPSSSVATLVPSNVTVFPGPSLARVIDAGAPPVQDAAVGTQSSKKVVQVWIRIPGVPNQRHFLSFASSGNPPNSNVR